MRFTPFDMHSTVALFGLVLGCSAARANDVYLAQTALGANTGQSCVNAYGYGFFNNSGNWGTGLGQIGPGTTVHLCGTFTAPAGASGYLSFQGGGTANNPITLTFDASAILTAPYWGNAGAITASGVNYIAVDGGTAGMIQASANGTGLANHAEGQGLYFSGVSNSEIRNLTISNLYVHTNSADEGGQGVYAIRWIFGSNNNIHNNTIHDVQTALLYACAPGATTSNINVYKNTVYNINWGLIIGDDGANSILNGSNAFHDNVIHDFAGWDDNVDNYHHDGIYAFINFAGSSFTGLQIYNNYIYGSPGVHTNTFIFLSDVPGGPIESAAVFNNVLVNAGPGYPSNGLVQDWAHDTGIYNNTLVGFSNANASGNDAISCNICSGSTIENNIFDTFYLGLYIPAGATVRAMNNNDWYNLTYLGAVSSNYYSTFASWLTCISGSCPATHDGNSLIGNPSLGSTFQPQTGSFAIGSGMNLGGLGIGPLDNDAAGRPWGASWGIGAYNSGGAVSLPSPPTALTLQVH